jgi:hypothetical protein
MKGGAVKRPEKNDRVRGLTPEEPQYVSDEPDFEEDELEIEPEQEDYYDSENEDSIDINDRIAYELDVLGFEEDDIDTLINDFNVLNEPNYENIINIYTNVSNELGYTDDIFNIDYDVKPEIAKITMDTLNNQINVGGKRIKRKHKSKTKRRRKTNKKRKNKRKSRKNHKKRH